MDRIKVKLRQSTVVGQPGSIVYAVTHKRKTRQLTTDYKVYNNEWDSNHAIIINNCNEEHRHNLLQTISQRIRLDIIRLKSIILKFESDFKEYNVDDIMNEYKRQSKYQSFFCYMQSTISRLRQLNKAGTADNYHYTLASFSNFRNNVDIRLEEISVNMIEEYEAWLKSNGVKPNSSSFYIRNLRAVYNRAVEDGLVVKNLSPFRKAYTGVVKTSKRSISIKKIKRIKELDLSINRSLEVARDIFLFLFYAMGMSFIDAAYLTKDNIINDSIVYHRHKTNQEIIVPLNPHINTILNKYKNDSSCYLLPIISDEICDTRKQYQSMIHRVNSQLKKIGKLAGISIPLTTYVSRHAWASIAKDKGIEIATISDALGHDNIKTTEIYLSTISRDKISKANNKILYGL